jgi:hypothetical protein
MGRTGPGPWEAVQGKPSLAPPGRPLARSAAPVYGFSPLGAPRRPKTRPPRSRRSATRRRALPPAQQPAGQRAVQRRRPMDALPRPKPVPRGHCRPICRRPPRQRRVPDGTTFHMATACPLPPIRGGSRWEYIIMPGCPVDSRAGRGAAHRRPAGPPSRPTGPRREAGGAADRSRRRGSADSRATFAAPRLFPRSGPRPASPRLLAPIGAAAGHPLGAGLRAPSRASGRKIVPARPKCCILEAMCLCLSTSVYWTRVGHRGG